LTFKPFIERTAPGKRRAASSVKRSSAHMLEDIPSPIDLRLMPDALEWAQTATEKRPYREDIFAEFARELLSAEPAVRRVLELGSGPGFLAQHLLRSLPAASFVLLDFSPAMHQLAGERLVSQRSRVELVERSFKDPDWGEGLGRFQGIVTLQAVHELRHKRHATALHHQAKALLAPGGAYLVCDHFVGEGGVVNDQLFMSVEEQQQALLDAGFHTVRQVARRGSLVLHHAA
jgi:SAM-dependent methyltransferase